MKGKMMKVEPTLRDEYNSLGTRFDPDIHRVRHGKPLISKGRFKPKKSVLRKYERALNQATFQFLENHP